tara:strand:- start:168 stop:428 length:261 start_codon:yes stop_codon:yes gene_type:complete
MAKKLKPGTLVELSAIGKKTHYCRHVRQKIGIITKAQRGYAWDPRIRYKIHWTPPLGDVHMTWDCRQVERDGYPRNVLKLAKSKNK